MSTAYDPIARPTYAGPAPDERLDRMTARPAVDTDEVPVFGTPIYARRATSKRSGPPPLAIGLGVAAAAVLAVGGYVLLQPRDQLMAEQSAALPAAAPPVTEIAAQTVTPPPAIMPEIPPATAPTPATRINESPAREAAAPVRAARVRPAPVADSPETWASDTSARMPDAPIPYSALGQTSATAPAVSAPVPEIVAPEPATPDPAAPAAQAPAQESPEEPTP